MKKSEIYNLAQVAVLESKTISCEQKIEILKELMDKQELEIYLEEDKGSDNEAV